MVPWDVLKEQIAQMVKTATQTVVGRRHGALGQFCILTGGELQGAWEAKPAVAREWCLRSSDAGNAEGCWVMGVIAENGSEKDPPDLVEAVR